MVVALAAVVVNHGLRGGVPDRVAPRRDLLSAAPRGRYRIDAAAAVLEEDPSSVGGVYGIVQTAPRARARSRAVLRRRRRLRRCPFETSRTRSSIHPETRRENCRLSRRGARPHLGPASPRYRRPWLGYRDLGRGRPSRPSATRRRRSVFRQARRRVGYCHSGRASRQRPRRNRSASGRCRSAPSGPIRMRWSGRRERSWARPCNRARL